MVRRGREVLPAPAGVTQPDLHAILDKAKAAGVRSVILDGIAYSFVHTKVDLPASPATGPAASRPDVSATPGAPETGPTADESSKSLLTTADITAMRAAEEAQQLIEDPAGFEQTQIDAHLTSDQEPTEGRAAH